MEPATQLKQVAPTLFGWAALHPQWKVFFQSYALKTDAGVILIDPTQPTKPVLDQLGALGEPAAIVLTNAHHDRAADWFRKEFEIQVYAHENAPPDCDSKIDVPVMDGEKLPGGLCAIRLPGVSPSELALFTKNGAGIMLMGDAILNTPGKGLELLPEQFIEDSKQARHSLHKLLEYDFEVVTFSHGDPIVAKGKAALADFLRLRRQS